MINTIYYGKNPNTGVTYCNVIYDSGVVREYYSEVSIPKSVKHFMENAPYIEDYSGAQYLDMVFLSYIPNNSEF